jgi:hypothetical protein
MQHAVVLRRLVLLKTREPSVTLVPSVRCLSVAHRLPTLREAVGRHLPQLDG